MKNKLTFSIRLLITGTVTLLIWGHLAWDYFHGGVPTHYVLHDGDLPGISNWWGGLALPLFTWLLLYRIHKRIDADAAANSESLQNVAYRFVAALLVGISIAVFFTLGIEVTDYIMLSLFALAFFIPLYKAEYLLGFVLGATFTFGAMIPIGFGSLLALLFFLFYKATRAIVGYVRPKEK